MADDSAIEITKVEPEGSETTFAIPSDTYRVLIQAVGGNATVAIASSGTTFTLLDGAPPLDLRSHTIGGRTLYLDAAATIDIEIMVFRGRLE